MINRKFLNFKTYNAFLEKLNSNEIPQDSIVFIQDKLCIWAHGKEYQCSGPSTSTAADGTLTFNDFKGNTVFTITQRDGILKLTDSEGNSISATYILKADYNVAIGNINRDIEDLKNADKQFALKDNLKDVAFTAEYSDLLHTPKIPEVDSQLNGNSENPVQNKAIYSKLGEKADKTELSKFIETTTYQQTMALKQDKLTAGYGISREDLERNIISSTLDTSVYVIVTSLPDPSEADPNKIYIRETVSANNTYRYEQFRLRNGQWVPIGDMSSNIDLSLYLTKQLAADTYQPKGNYLTSVDLNPYALTQDLETLRSNLADYALRSYVNENFQPKGEYATKAYVDEYFVKWIDVYNQGAGTSGNTSGSGSNDNPSTGGGNDNPGGGSNTPTIINQTTIITQEVELDDELSLSSQHGVKNYVIKLALDTKADASALNNYATKDQLNTKADASSLQNYVQSSDLNTALEAKQDVLTPGRGISIINNVISSTLDTSVYIFADDFPAENDINPDKIYIIEGEDNGDPIYTQYRWNGEEWVPLGQIVPEVDLTAYLRSDTAAQTYLSKSDAQATYQPIGDYQPAGNYADADDVAATYQEKGNYIDQSTFEAFILNVNSTFQRKGGYALASDVSMALTTLQQIIDQKYVLKRDVYNPANSEWSSSDPASINIAASAGSGEGGESTGGGSSAASNMITLTVDQYESLVRANLVDENTYYFTYEDDTWTFGETFPIKLT